MKNKNIGYFATTVKPNGIWEYLAYFSKINAENSILERISEVIFCEVWVDKNKDARFMKTGFRAVFKAVAITVGSLL